MWLWYKILQIKSYSMSILGFWEKQLVMHKGVNKHQLLINADNSRWRTEVVACCILRSASSGYTIFLHNTSSTATRLLTTIRAWSSIHVILYWGARQKICFSVKVNNLASLEAMLVQNYEAPSNRLNSVKITATSKAKNCISERILLFSSMESSLVHFLAVRFLPIWNLVHCWDEQFDYPVWESKVTSSGR